ncbi:MAG: hypothetical protein HC777_00020 [Hyphomonadaceae bacterium]|nr:hypothetical protein [Hyphomonadaceae bacterium]
MTLYADSPLIDFDTRVDWQDSRKLLKVAFETNIRSRTGVYDLPFGHIERATHRNTGFDQAKFEVCGHKWADLSEGNYGVALLNDCKYGYDIKGNVMRLSLLRSPVRPTLNSDLCEHIFSYALLPHSGGWREAQIDRHGYSFNISPLVVVKTPSSDGGSHVMPSTMSFVEVEAKATIIEAIKQSEDGNGLIIRTFDSHGTHDKVRFTFGVPLTHLGETNLLEEPLNDLGWERSSFVAHFCPYEIKTFRFDVSQPKSIDST